MKRTTMTIPIEWMPVLFAYLTLITVLIRLSAPPLTPRQYGLWVFVVVVTMIGQTISLLYNILVVD